ncbi:MAG: Gfo/Idh/MocA family oxidoreductase [Planctomycetes bacterium]|nr:Gfo/Idh/MocA family oxidoreductase [Planctomycetota bacterium]
MKRAELTRRDFLGRCGRSAGIAGALCGAPAALAGPLPGRRLEKVRMGVVGGGFGCSFFWHLHPHSTVHAVSDLREDRRQRLRETFGCDLAYPSLTELLKDRDVDAVALFTPAPDHVRHAVEVLRAGKHCISAVPAAMSLEECEQLVDAARETGLTYMMAETSYYHQETITARRWFKEGKFGEIFSTEAEYHHDGLESLYWEGGQRGGKRTWRHGLPPMLYPTHCTAFLTGVTGERLTDVMSLGWGDGDEVLEENAYGNPFWSETALFKTDRGHALRVHVYWKVAAGGCERAQWYGDRMSFFTPDALGRPAMVHERGKPPERFETPSYWQTELPEPLRRPSGHGGSHTFLTHEFIDALVSGRRPAIDVYEAVAFTAPGIVAHRSSREGGRQMKIPDFGKAE